MASDQEMLAAGRSINAFDLESKVAQPLAILCRRSFFAARGNEHIEILPRHVKRSRAVLVK